MISLLGKLALSWSYTLYIKVQLFILRPEISLILNLCVIDDVLMKWGSVFFTQLVIDREFQVHLLQE